MERAQISAWQFFVLVFGYLLGTSFFFRPGGLIVIAKQDAWIVPLWAGVAGILMSLLWMHLADYYPGLSIVQICTQAGGRVIGGVMALMYIGYFVHLSSLITRNLGDFMSLTLMPRTPLTVFHLMLLIVTVYAVIKGVEAIARTTEVMFPIVTLTFMLIFLLALPEWNWNRFQGMFQFDVWSTMKESRSIFGFPYMEAITLMMLFPYIQRQRKGVFLLGIIVTTLLLSLITFFMIGVLGVTRASHTTYPLFLIVQEIQIGTFIEHLDSTIALILVIAIFIKLTVAYYSAVIGLSQLFQLRDRSWLAFSLIFLVAGLALGFDNILQNITFAREYYFEYMLLFAIIFPVILLVITRLKQIIGNTKRGSES